MAFLSDTTYNKLAKYSDDSSLVLMNKEGEFSQSLSIISLKKTKSKIKTRWETTNSSNTYPFTHAALVIRGRNAVMSSIKPLEYTSTGYIDIEYESEA